MKETRSLPWKNHSRRRGRGGAGFLLALALLAGAARAPAMEIVANGESPYVIALAQDVEAARLRQPAELLRWAVEESTGVSLPVVTESDVAPDQPAIYLGKSRAAAQAGIPLDDIEGWAYRNRTVGRDIFLIGHDAPSGIEGGRATLDTEGTFKAVTAFLEQQAGVRFVLPGRNGTHVPTTDTLRVDADMDASWAPWMRYVIGRSVRPHTLQDRAYAVANHYFGPTPIVRTYGGHSYYTAVPSDTYGKSNPEYFALLGGVRTPEGNHLCISNPDVHELMLQEMERELDRGYEWVELAQTDGYKHCECDECAAIHPDSGEALWIVHRKLAEEMQQRRPGKMIMLLSYSHTNAPPQTFATFPENVVVQLCAYTPEHFERWSAFEVPKTVYLYNWLAWHPRISPGYAVRQARLFRKHDVRGIYLCGGLDTWSAWGLDGPSFYAYGRALHDPDVDPDAVRAEYVNAAFGEAAGPMQTFFRTLHRRTNSFWMIDRRSPALLQGRGDFECHFYSPQVLSDMERSLARALDIADDPDVKARLRLVDIEFDYLKHNASVHHFYRAYRLAPSWETLALLENSITEFNQALDRVFPEGQAVNVPGLRPAFTNVARTRLAMAGSAPFNWNFDVLREKNVLPGLGMQRTVAHRMEAIELNGRMDHPAWADIPAAELSEIGMGELRNESRFKVAYDDAHLYIGFAAEITDPDELDYLQPAGRDGPGWLQENIELVIDAFGDRQRYVHLIVNPVPESKFDRRFGYIDDPLHPLFENFERDWRGEWDYAAHIDRENLRWTMEIRIPYSTFGAEAPEPGTVWTMNVGRTQYPNRSGASFGHPFLSLWSPNIESRSFHDRSAFGELTFR